jgi:hypothetical protein
MPRKLVYKYHHVGIPTETKKSGMVDLPHLRICASDHESNPFGIQWMLYQETCDVPQLVRTLPHVAFEVKDLKAALQGKRILIEPNSPSPGVQVAFIEEAGAPVELLEFTNRGASRAYRRRE